MNEECRCPSFWHHGTHRTQPCGNLPRYVVELRGLTVTLCTACFIYARRRFGERDWLKHKAFRDMNDPGW